MSATIQSNATAWADDAQASAPARGSRRRLGLLLMTASAATTTYSLWAIGVLVARLLGS